MIGYYVHHVGHGHRHRAAALAAALDEPVVGLSSVAPPSGWTGEWVSLDRDDAWTEPRNPTAGGPLHWAPEHDPGLRSRMAAVSAWLEKARPRAVVVDVSVEVALLVRLHGTPVVVVVQPGDRSDAAHRLGYGVADLLVGFWPPEATGMVTGLDDAAIRRLVLLGALSRDPVALPAGPGRRDAADPRHVVVLSGSGGLDDGWRQGVDRARRETSGWRWTVLGGTAVDATWSSDPAAALADADVVITHAGQNALAEVAAARRPALVVPQRRPHDEQATTAQALAAGPWPVEVLPDGLPSTGWAERLTRVAALDGSRWAAWCDGGAAERFARALQQVGRAG